MSAPPDVYVDYDTRWLEVDLEADPDTWARTAAEEAWRRSGHQYSKRDLRGLTQTLAALSQAVREYRPIGAFLLVPEPWAGVSAVVKMLALDTGTPHTLDQLLGLLTQPPESLVRPPEIDRLDSGAGQVARISQYVVDTSDGAGSDRRVAGESLQYVWTFPERSAALVLGTAFTDPVEGARWRPALDGLATAVTPVGAP